MWQGGSGAANGVIGNERGVRKMDDAGLETGERPFGQMMERAQSFGARGAE